MTLKLKLKTRRYGNEISWTFGRECASNGGYEDESTYIEKCKVRPGVYTLECKDSYGDGWNGGYLEIQGIKYCEKFQCPFHNSNCRTERQKVAKVTILPSYLWG